MPTKQLCSVVLAGCLVLVGCENAQEKARYVKEPLETVDTASLVSVNSAVREARTRLVTVRNEELRAELSKDIDDDYQRMLSQIQETERLEKERAAVEAEKKRQEIEREERREAMLLQKERDAEREANRRTAEANRHAVEASQRTAEVNRSDAEPDPHDLNRQAVKDLEVGTRPSLLGDGTQVLVLRNTRRNAADFDLTCYTRGDEAKKTFMVNVPPRSEKHVGFLQGWCGNFKPGERCEAHCDGELLWNRTIR